MKNTNKLTIVALLTLTLFAVSGCNTFKGMGKDFESMGESMQKAGD
ncbi:MAG: entericidin [Opitutales bacterium]